MDDKIPSMHVLVTRNGELGSEQFAWSVTYKDRDATSTRTLGYRGSGVIAGDMSIEFQYGPAVHDENRPVWTPMNFTDRPDVRKKITQLAIAGMKRLKESNENRFERIIE